jgi:hypothetical protein
MTTLDVAVIDTAIQILRDGGVTLGETTFPYTCYALRAAQGKGVQETSDSRWNDDPYLIPFVKFSAEKFGALVHDEEHWRLYDVSDSVPNWWSSRMYTAVTERISHLLEFRATIVNGELE